MIAVTGANGLLGSFLVRKLNAERVPFVALKQQNSDTSLLKDINESITWREATLLDPVSLNEALHDITAVIHAAAIVSFNPREERKMFDVNVLGTRNVVDTCLALNIKRMVHISSVAALGRQKEKKIITEDNKWVNSALNSAYAESKYLAELEVFRGQEEGLNTVTLNPSVILAPADWNRSSAQIFKYIWKKRPFYFNGMMNYVDVRDVADIAYQLVHSPFEAERFIINAGNISFHDLFHKVAANFNTRAPHIRLGRKTLKILAALEAVRAFIQNKTPLITRESARLAGTEFLFDNEKISKALNFKFQTIDKTLQWCCEYYLRQVNGKK